MSPTFEGMMLHFITLCILVVLAFTTTNTNASTERQPYVIHMDRTKLPPSATPSPAQWYQSLLDSVTEITTQEQGRNPTPPTLLYAYDTVVSGFAAKLSAAELRSLTQTTGFVSAIPDEILTLHTTHTPKFLGLEQGKGLWSQSSLESDVIVGILDTGIWPEHPSFQSGSKTVPLNWKGQCETGTKFSPANCNGKLIGAMSFYKGYESAAGAVNETVDYRSPRDSNGHGTHTASTAAGALLPNANFLGLANGSAAGMRYTARIAVYKVCWARGCTNSDILAAMEQAVKDGVDVLSLSLGGSPKPYYSDNVAIASFGAVQNGVFVSCSAGNSGPLISSVSNTAPWIMTVAASYTDRGFPTSVRLGNGEVYEGSSLYYGKPTKQLPIAYAQTAGGKLQGANYCIDGTLNKKLVKGKMVICDRGISGRTQKGEVVKSAGGAGMILVNGDSAGEERFADPHVLPATSLGASAGKSLKKYITTTSSSSSIKKSKPTASITFKGTTYGSAAPAIAAFSSRGPSSVGPETIKPDITAPGVNILAAWPPGISPTMLKSDNRSVLFNIISGTSMSCPHISGIAALLKSVHKDWSPAAIKSAMMTTAYVVDNKNNPIADFGSNSTATAFGFGSGHVDPERASDPGLIYDVSTEDYLNHLCSLNYTSAQISAVMSGKSFDCPSGGIGQAGDLNYPSFAVNFKSGGSRNGSSIRFRRTVTNVGKIGRYEVKVEEPNGVSVKVKPGVLEFGKLGEKLSYDVEFVDGGGKGSSFGAVVWTSGKYCVRSPIAASWEQ
ncbi:Subtilisin-like protease SBT1.1 [Linum perenne]